MKIILLPFSTFTGKGASVDFAVAFEGGGMSWNPTLTRGFHDRELDPIGVFGCPSNCKLGNLQILNLFVFGCEN